MSQNAAGSPHRGSLLLFWLLALVLAFAPLFRAANRPVPLMILELGAVALLVARFWVPRTPTGHVSSGLYLTLAALLVLPLLYLVPLPETLWAGLPGRALYGEALSLAQGDAAGGLRPAAIYARLTEGAALALLVPVAVFLGCTVLSTGQLFRLLIIVLVIAGLEAGLGLIQYGAGPESAWYLGNPWAGKSAAGTYINRDHLAGLLEMTLPVTLALLAATVGRGNRPKHYRRGLRRRLAFLASIQGNRAVWFAALALVILLGLIFTRSRTGVALAMAGIFLSMLAFSGRLGGTNVFGVVGSFFAAGVSLAAIIGLAPVLQRFTVEGTLENTRWEIFASTLEGIGRLFPLGSGPGSFPQIYPRFQPEWLTGFVTHVHNDYLEWLFEGGLLAGALMALLLWFYLRQWPRVWQGQPWSTFQFAQVGAGIGILMMILHGFVDFNLHIPANAVMLALLAGVFFHRPEQPRVHKGGGRRRPADKAAQDSGAGAGAAAGVGAAAGEGAGSDTRQPAPERIPNPFEE